MITITVNAEGDILFPPEFDERYQLEVSDRGYLSHVAISMPDGSKYPLHFTQPLRLEEDLARLCKFGPCLYVEVGLVVVPDLSLNTLIPAVRDLVSRGYFRFLKTIDEAPNPWDV